MQIFQSPSVPPGLFHLYLHSSFSAGFNHCLGPQEIHPVEELPVVTGRGWRCTVEHQGHSLQGWQQSLQGTTGMEQQPRGIAGKSDSREIKQLFLSWKQPHFKSCSLHKGAAGMGLSSRISTMSCPHHTSHPLSFPEKSWELPQSWGLSRPSSLQFPGAGPRLSTAWSWDTELAAGLKLPMALAECW